ncbi:MAG: HAD family hydrolase [Rubrivivax sp.]|nr:HAD family hydrolase [Rubrivivax sp.]MBK7263674.1 HAD family hydrolase [Rubrivivax sp.]MBK8526807.1 HAD family hydrolase [Rubrivivax sp.]
MSAELVFLLDVDNTLLDNDRVIDDLRRHLQAEFGIANANRYFAIFEALRDELGYANYLGALQRYRSEIELDPTGDCRLLRMSDFLLDYPFADRLYPGALEVIAHLDRLGRCVILTDGDVVFQPRKVQRSGLWDAVDGRVLIYVHKEQRLDAVQQLYPARHYVLVDDKLRILSAVKSAWQQRVSTVFPRQGHYAHDPKIVAAHPAPDLSIDRIGELADADLMTLTKESA